LAREVLILLTPDRQLFFSWRLDRGVEPRDGDVAVPVLQLADDTGERVDGIRGDTAVQTRMQVDRRTRRMQLHVQQPAKPREKDRPELLVEAPVPHHDRVGLQLGRVLADEPGERLSADLLLALYDKPQV